MFARLSTLFVVLPVLLVSWMDGRWLSVTAVHTLLIGACVTPWLAALVVGLRTLKSSEDTAAQALDDCYQLQGMVRSACHFARMPAEQRSAFEEACIQRAAAKSPTLATGPVVPLRHSIQAAVLALTALVAASGAAQTLGYSSHAQKALPTKDVSQSATKSAESWPQRTQATYELRRIAAELERDGENDALASNIRQLANTVEHGQRNEADVLAALQTLERHASTLRTLDVQSWASLIDALTAQRLTAPLAAALRNGRPADVQRAARDLRASLPAKLAKERTQLQEQLARLQASLAPQDRRERLLHRPQAARQRSPSTQTSEQPLEQLRRRLRRAQAALEPKHENDAKDALDEAVRELESLDRKQRDRERATKAARQLAQLRQELLRAPQSAAQDQAAGDMAKRAVDDVTHARGQAQSHPSSAAPHPGAHAEGVRMRPQNAQGGAHSAEPGTPLSSSEAATAASEDTSGPATQVQGHAGAGPTRRQVIAAASSAGFATVGYQKVHADYVEYEEREMEHAPLSDSDRFVIQRYFQLIRPTQGNP